MYLLYFCITISYNTLLVIDKPQAIELDIGITVRPNPVRDNEIELDVVAIRTIVSKDFSIVVSVLHFLIFLFWFITFVFEVSNHFFNIVDMVIKAVNII